MNATGAKREKPDQLLQPGSPRELDAMKRAALLLEAQYRQQCLRWGPGIENAYR